MLSKHMRRSDDHYQGLQLSDSFMKRVYTKVQTTGYAKKKSKRVCTVLKRIYRENQDLPVPE